MDNYVLLEICQKTDFVDLCRLTMSGYPMAQVACEVLAERKNELSTAEWERALLAVVRERDTATLKCLLVNGGSDLDKVNWRLVYRTAAECKGEEVCRFLCEDERHVNLLGLHDGAGRSGDLRMCQLAVDCLQKVRPEEQSVGYNETQMKAECMRQVMSGAARGGHMVICRWVLETVMGEGTEGEMLEVMLENAARRGDVSLCQMAQAWGREVGVRVDINSMLCGAARGGHIELCHDARVQGGYDYDSMAYAAAEGGHKECCLQAIDWGAELNPAYAGADNSKVDGMNEWVETVLLQYYESLYPDSEEEVEEEEEEEEEEEDDVE